MVRHVAKPGSDKRPSSFQKASFAIEPIVIEDDDDDNNDGDEEKATPSDDEIADLEKILSHLTASIDIKLRQHKRQQEQRRQAELALAAKHAADESREEEEIKSLRRQEIKDRKRFSELLLFRTGLQKNGGFSTNPKDAPQAGESSGAHPLTPQSSHTPVSHAQEWSSPSTEREVSRAKPKAESDLDHSLTEGEQLLLAFGAKRRPRTPQTTNNGFSRNATASEPSSRVRVKSEAEADDDDSDKIRFATAKPKAERASRRRQKRERSPQGIRETPQLERVDDELNPRPSRKRTRRTGGFNKGAIKMEDGELICRPVRMPPSRNSPISLSS